MTDSPDLFPAMGRFRSRLNAGELQIGAGVTFNDPLVSEALADSADFLWFDLDILQANCRTVLCSKRRKIQV